MVYRLKDNVKLTVSENGAYLERIGTEERYVTGGVGIEIIQLIDGERDMDGILEELLKMYGPNVEAYTVARDLEKFVGELSSEGLIELIRNSFQE